MEIIAMVLFVMLLVFLKRRYHLGIEDAISSLLTFVFLSTLYCCCCFLTTVLHNLRRDFMKNLKFHNEWHMLCIFFITISQYKCNIEELCKEIGYDYPEKQPSTQKGLLHKVPIMLQEKDNLIHLRCIFTIAQNFTHYRPASKNCLSYFNLTLT